VRAIELKSRLLTGQAIDLETPFAIRSCFLFPLQNEASRREVLIGALWLLVPGVGWLLNMGHRIVMVHRMMHGQPAWPAWHDYGSLLWHGAVTFLGMVLYYMPGALAAGAASRTSSVALTVLAGALIAAATVAIPGFMSHYCRSFDVREIFNPFLALRRCLQGGALYWRAWLIALSALAISFLGLLVVGFGFLVSSVWFWQVAGFGFASAMAKTFGLSEGRTDSV
jgi:hypothetical protein